MIIHENVSLADHCTFKIGGKVCYFFEPTSIEEILFAIQFLKDKSLPYFILGEGSNVLIGSGDYPGGVLSLLKMNQIQLKDSYQIQVGAGVINSDLSSFAYQNSIKGFEFLYRMPGSLGGSTLMNAKAFGSSLSDVILEVKVIGPDFKITTFKNKDCGFGYKQSLFQNGDYILVEVLVQGSSGEQDRIKLQMEENEQKRLSTKQYDFPSAGCIFKNNYEIGIPTGKIIDDLGLKGLKIGDAEVYQQHGNFIVNKGSATSEDVMTLINLLKKKVKEEKGLDLDCEIRFLGNFA